jgi:PhnB protein
MAFHPYLFFSGGSRREAFERYQQIFGGELALMTNGDAPPGEGMPRADPSSVMHASLAGGETLLMGSDDPTGDGGQKAGIAVSYSTTDVSQAARVFEALAEGGEVQMAFEPVFWSKGFGACIDRFGIPWMIDAGEPEQSTN